MDSNKHQDHQADPAAGALFAAVTAQDVEQVRELLAHGADANETGEHPAKADGAPVAGVPALFAAVFLGNFEITKFLLEHGADANLAEPSEGRLPLIRAAGKNRVAIVRLLLDHKADVNKTMENGCSALYMAAAWSNNVELVRLLLSAGAAMEKAENNGARPLHVASQNSHADCVAQLLRAGVDKDAVLPSGASAVYLATEKGHAAVLKQLLDAGCDADKAAEDGWRSLHTASAKGHADCVAQLLRAGVDKAAVLPSGASAVYLAALNGHAAVLKQLLDAGCDAETAKKDGSRPLHIACNNGHVDCVAELLRAGVDKTAVLPDDTSAVLLAAEKGHAAVLKQLLDAGCDAERADNDGWRPLHAASRNGHADCVAVLLQAGCDPEKAATNDFGHLPLHVAAGTGHLECMKELLRAGASMATTANGGITIATAAAAKGCVAVLEYLAAAGCDVISSRFAGLAPYAMALREQQWAAALFLFPFTERKARHYIEREQQQFVADTLRDLVSKDRSSFAAASAQHAAALLRLSGRPLMKELQLATRELHQAQRLEWRVLMSFSMSQQMRCYIDTLTRQSGTAAAFAQLSRKDYAEQLAQKLQELSTGTPSPAAVIAAPPAPAERAAASASDAAAATTTSSAAAAQSAKIAAIAVPTSPSMPLFTDPAKYRGSFNNIVEWLLALPDLEAAAVPDVNARKQFGAVHDLQQLQDRFANQIAQWLKTIAEELQNPGPSYIASLMRHFAGKPTAHQEATAVQQRLHAAVDALHQQGVDPAVAADELASVLLYTSDLGFLPGTKTKCSIFAVSNLLLRTCRAAGNQPDSDTQKLLAVYAPFIVRTDAFLCRMPKQRRTLFRGVGAELALEHYGAGSLVAWGQFNSTTTDVSVAQGFSEGKTLFVVHAGSTAQVDFASVFPNEAETLLPSSSVFTSLGVTSPGLMRLLGQHGNMIQLRELADDPTPQQVVAGMEEAKHALATLSDTFTESYVEARIFVAPPPLPDDAPCLLLFQHLLPRFLQRIDEFSADNNKLPHLALLGMGGTGKTSTLLALHTHISHNEHLKHLPQQQQPSSKPVISIFVALPKLPGNVQDGKCIDAQVFAELGARDHAHASAIAAEATILVLLDSLDECTVSNSKSNWKPLLDCAPFCKQHCRVIVSSRPEFADRLPSGTSIFGFSCQEMHVLPLTAAQHDSYITKFVAARNTELETHVKIHKTSKFTKFQVTESAVRTALDKLQLGDDDQRLPVVLTMALEVAVHDVRHPNAAAASAGSDAAAAAVSAPAPFTECCPPPGTRSHVMHRFLESRRTVILPDATEHTIDDTSFHNLYTALQDVALSMLHCGDWNVALGKIRSQILDSIPATSNNESDNDRALRVFGKHVPCRVESVHDHSSLFGFWHKSLGEYLCARTLFLDPTVSITNKLTTAFSLREPNVCWFFNDLCYGDSDRRLDVTAGPLYEIVRDSTSSPAAISNAFALIGCSGESIDGWDFTGVKISDCNLQGADLSQGVFDNAQFHRCTLRDASFACCRVEGASFERGTFSLKLAPIVQPLKVGSAAVTRDEQFIITGGVGGDLRFFSTDTGELVRTTDAHSDAHDVDACCLFWIGVSQSTVVSIGPGQIVVTALASGIVRHCIDTKDKGLYAAAHIFGDSLATFHENANCIRVWDIECGTQKYELLCSSDVASLGFVNDKWLLSGHSGGRIQVWDLTCNTSRSFDNLHDGKVMCLASCSRSDGVVVASGGADGTVRVYSCSEIGGGGLRSLQLLKHHVQRVHSVAFSPDGTRLASGSADRSVKVCDVCSGSVIHTIGHAAAAVIWVSFLEGNNVVSLDGNSTVRVWNTSQVRQELRHAHCPTSSVQQLCVTSDGAVVCSYVTHVGCWDGATGRQLWAREVDNGDVGALALDLARDDSFIIIGGGQGVLRRWNMPGCREQWKSTFEHVPACATQYIDDVAITPDAQTVAASMNRVICVFDAASGAHLRVVSPDRSHPRRSVTVSFDGRSVVYAEPGSIHICSMDSSSSSSSSGNSRIIDVDAEDHLVVCSPDGAFVAFGDETGRVTVCNFATGEQLGSSWKVVDSDEPCAVTAMSFSRDSAFLVTGTTFGAPTSLSAVKPTRCVTSLWSVSNNGAAAKHVYSFSSGHFYAVKAVKLSPDGKWIASAGLDGEIHVIAVPASGPPPPVDRHRRRMFRIAGSDDSFRGVIGQVAAGSDSVVKYLCKHS